MVQRCDDGKGTSPVNHSSEFIDVIAKLYLRDIYGVFRGTPLLSGLWPYLADSLTGAEMVSVDGTAASLAARAEVDRRDAVLTQNGRLGRGARAGRVGLVQSHDRLPFIRPKP